MGVRNYTLLYTREVSRRVFFRTMYFRNTRGLIILTQIGDKYYNTISKTVLATLFFSYSESFPSVQISALCSSVGSKCFQLKYNITFGPSTFYLLCSASSVLPKLRFSRITAPSVQFSFSKTSSREVSRNFFKDKKNLDYAVFVCE